MGNKAFCCIVKNQERDVHEGARSERSSGSGRQYIQQQELGYRPSGGPSVPHSHNQQLAYSPYSGDGRAGAPGVYISSSGHPSGPGTGLGLDSRSNSTSRSNYGHNSRANGTMYTPSSKGVPAPGPGQGHMGLTLNLANANGMGSQQMIGYGNGASSGYANSGEAASPAASSASAGAFLPFVPHISDREPEGNEHDPADNPKLETLFLSKAANEMRRNYAYRRRNHARLPPQVARLLRRSSSCSTLMVSDSSISVPNLKVTIKAVSLAVYFHLKHRRRDRETPAQPGARGTRERDHDLEIFDEKLHPILKETQSGGSEGETGPSTSGSNSREPDHKSIYRFIRQLFGSAQLTAECAIVTLVYLERLVTYAEVEITPASWRRILLGSILLASKVWDDQAVWNVDYCQILKDLQVDDVNELERRYLELLEFNINVPSSVYARYYFALRTLAECFELTAPPALLTRERAAKLEAASWCTKEFGKQQTELTSLRATRSLNSITAHARHSNRAVLS